MTAESSQSRRGNLKNHFSVRHLRSPAGEHLPVVVDSRTGLPLFDPLAYALTRLRGAGMATNTIEQYCRVITLLYWWLESSEIDLDARFGQGLILEGAEVSDLVSLFRLTAEDFVAQCTKRASARRAMNRPARSLSAISLESVRRAPPRQRVQPTVSPHTTAIRVLYAKGLLCFLADAHANRQTTPDEVRALLHQSRASVERLFDALAPRAHLPSDSPVPQGLSDEQVKLLQSVIEPDSPMNPWTDPFVQRRNYLIVTLLHALGIRGGELLKLKTTDVTQHNSSVAITRSPDDGEDPRRYPPQAKTTARVLPVSRNLLAALTQFIATDRRRIPGARRHPFVFTSITGAPLSLNSLYKLFDTLREKHPGLDANLTAHLLRYTATDEFLAALDQADMDSQVKDDELRYVFGWSASSQMPQRYGRRHIEQQANEVLLQRQAKMMKNGDKNK